MVFKWGAQPPTSDFFRCIQCFTASKASVFCERSLFWTVVSLIMTRTLGIHGDPYPNIPKWESFITSDLQRKNWDQSKERCNQDLKFFAGIWLSNSCRSGKLHWKNFRCLGPWFLERDGIQSSLQQTGWLPFLPESRKTKYVSQFQVYQSWNRYTHFPLNHDCGRKSMKAPFDYSDG